MIGRMNRREVLLALSCVWSARTHAASPLSPAAFPWAVDRTGHISRRIVSKPQSNDITEPAIDLMPLHLALNTYMSAPDDARRIVWVRYHLAIVQAATANTALPFPWREIHYACVLLLGADQWHRILE